MESWEVAALNPVQEPRHAPRLYRAQLIINVFQILRPTTQWGRVSPGNRGHAVMTHPQTDREEPCFHLLPPAPTERGVRSQNGEGKSQSWGCGFKGAGLGGSSREHCCDHLVAQKAGSWRSLALAVRFGVGVTEVLSEQSCWRRAPRQVRGTVREGTGGWGISTQRHQRGTNDPTGVPGHVTWTRSSFKARTGTSASNIFLYPFD